LSDLTAETNQAQPNYAYYLDPTAGMFAGCIGVPTDVLTTEDITADIIGRTITGLIVGMCVEFIDVHTGGVITNAIVVHGRGCLSTCVEVCQQRHENKRGSYHDVAPCSLLRTTALTAMP
jgi:hypothetical protein